MNTSNQTPTMTSKSSPSKAKPHFFLDTLRMKCFFSVLFKCVCVICRYLWWVLGVLYVPIFLGAWLLHKVANILLSISYFFTFDYKLAGAILSKLFELPFVFDKRD